MREKEKEVGITEKNPPLRESGHSKDKELIYIQLWFIAKERETTNMNGYVMKIPETRDDISKK